MTDVGTFERVDLMLVILGIINLVIGLYEILWGDGEAAALNIGLAIFLLYLSSAKFERFLGVHQNG